MSSGLPASLAVRLLIVGSSARVDPLSLFASGVGLDVGVAVGLDVGLGVRLGVRLGAGVGEGGVTTTTWVGVGVGVGVGVATTAWVGVGRGVGVAATVGGGGVGVATATGVEVGLGDGVTVPIGGVGLLPLAPGMNEKSSAMDDEIHGCCSRLDARVTPTRVRLSVSSAIWSGTRISLSNSCTNRL